jgi:hypothetical protein
MFITSQPGSVSGLGWFLTGDWCFGGTRDIHVCSIAQMGHSSFAAVIFLACAFVFLWFYDQLPVYFWVKMLLVYMEVFWVIPSLSKRRGSSRCPFKVNEREFIERE